MIEQVIEKLKSKKDLSSKETEGIFTEIMSGKAATESIAVFLLALKEKGETVDEITAAARVMRKFATKINTERSNLLDTCGTGGDSSGTINVSTISALVAAGAGARVAKHGNRAVSSRCGSADLLEKLGVNINAPIKTLEKCVNEIGIGFLFAPMFHSAMKYAREARKTIKTRSIFNILGPLTNPADASCQVVGVYDEGLVRTIADVLKNLGSKRALVVRGKDGLDEITTAGDTSVAELKEGDVKEYMIRPEDFGFVRAKNKDLKGGDAEFNKGVALGILKGEIKSDIVLLNSGAAIYITGLAKDIKDGIKKAKEAIDSGQAMEKLKLLKKITNA
ncbi:MAG: anthranilate phosphoribosyltransferase [Candidatus Omnitrophica bacterium]|nr:anthranilate phosphoribosyltransferase [Candidatus Omnitrophota bacterium]